MKYVRKQLEVPGVRAGQELKQKPHFCAACSLFLLKLHGANSLMWTKHSISWLAGQSILSKSAPHPQKRTAVKPPLRSSPTNVLDLGQCFPTAGRDPTWAGVKTGFTRGHKVLEKAKEIFKLKDFCWVFSQLVGGREGAELHTNRWSKEAGCFRNPDLKYWEFHT